jgi:hypothetical protein
MTKTIVRIILSQSKLVVQRARALVHRHRAWIRRETTDAAHGCGRRLLASFGSQTCFASKGGFMPLCARYESVNAANVVVMVDAMASPVTA